MSTDQLQFPWNMGFTVLSVDPGVARVGWAVLRQEDGITPTVVNMGVLVDQSDKNLTFNERMNEQIHQFMEEFDKIISSYAVTHVVWEIVPSFGMMGNQSRILATATTLKVLTFQHQLPYTELSPQRWHKMFLGKAKDVKKKEVVDKLKCEYPSLDPLSYDEADATAIGLMALDCEESEWKHFVKV